MARIDDMKKRLLAQATLLDIEEGNDDRRYELGVRGITEVNDRVSFENMGDAIRDPGPMLEPTIGYIPTLDTHLFYAGMMHSVFGPASAGKSLLLARLAADELVKGSSVMWLDAEVRSARHPMGQRLHAMGYDGNIGDRLWFALINRPMSQDNRDMFTTTIKNEGINLVIVDSLGELIGMNGGDPNRDPDIVKAMRFFEPLAAAGAAVVFVDHPSKSDRWSASGSGRKANHIDVAYAMNADLDRGDREANAARGFSRYKAGYSRIFCTKDRHGTFSDYQCVVRMTVTPTENGERLFVDFEADNGEDDIDEMIGEQQNRQAVVSTYDKLVAYMADGSNVTKRRVKDVCGYTNMKQADEFIGKMMREGVIEVIGGSGESRMYRLTDSHVPIQ